MRTPIHKANFVLTKTVKIIKGRGFKGLLAKIKEKVFSDDFKDYQLFVKRTELTIEQLELQRKQSQEFLSQPLISIITPVYKPSIEVLTSAIKSCLGQSYLNWELCLADASNETKIRSLLCDFQNKDSRIKVKFLSENKGISLASNEAISLATGEFIGLLDHDDELALNALFEVVKLLQTQPDADMVYTDEDKITLEGKRCSPFFKPDWSPDLFLSQMYTCHFGVYRKSIIDEIGGFREGFDGSQDYDLVLRFTENTNKIFHIPKILYHWRTIRGSTAENISAKATDAPSIKALSDALDRRSIKGSVEKGIYGGLFRVKRSLLKNPRISIIIPTKDQVRLLRSCVYSILNKTDYKNYEIVIVDNNSIHKNTKEYFNDLIKNENIRILSYAKPFNYSAINNYAVSMVESEGVLFLNNDMEVISSEWLSAMVEHIQREEVGAVGAKLLFPNDTIQHAGVVLGIGVVAGHAFKGLQGDINHSYFGHADAIRNYSAVTGACMMVRKKAFTEIGGFDESNLPVAFNDIDLCLRLRERGYLIVYTPYAVLYHCEAASRGYKKDPEEEYFIKRWGHIIENDPYYNPNLSRERFDFSLRYTHHD